jgi:hypothetical protein
VVEGLPAAEAAVHRVRRIAGRLSPGSGLPRLQRKGPTVNPTQNRRAFLGTLGLFSILPSAGRVWKAIRADPLSEIDTRFACVVDYCGVIEYQEPTPEWVQAMNDAVLGPGPRIRPSPAESQAFLEAFFYGKRIPQV